MNQHHSKTRTRLRTAAALGLGTVLLAGCGAGEPGAAITVGDRSHTVAEIDAMTDDLCAAMTPSLQSSETVLPRLWLRSWVATSTVQSDVALAVGESFGLKPGPEYRSAVAERAAALPDLDEAARETAARIYSAEVLLNDMAGQVGAAVLAEQGVTDPAPEQVQQAADEAFSQWYADSDVEIDPRLELAVQDGQFGTVDSSLGVAVSDIARNGANMEDPSFAKDLPSSQRCG